MRLGFFGYSRVMGLLLGAALLTAPACFAAGPAYVGVQSEPLNYATYPSYQYDGATVYLIDGRWYRRDHGRWGYYRSEPRELYRYRSRAFVAPPARSRDYRYSAPARRDSRHYSAPRVNSAPRTYSAPPRHDDRRHQAPRRDEHHYRAPTRDNHHDRGRSDDHRRHSRD